MRQTGVLRSKFIWRASAFLFVAAVLLPIQQSAHAEGDGAGNNLTSQCKITLPERSTEFAARLSDNRYNSRISFKPAETLEVQLVSGAKGVYVAWYTAPEAAMIEMLDASGGMAAGVSTSGLFMKEPGRVGDSPVIGSGFYCDARYGAAAATGAQLKELLKKLPDGMTFELSLEKEDN